MKVAALDLGTNSFLLLIAEGGTSKTLHVEHDEMVIVRLGQDLGSTGQIHPEALKRAEMCLKIFSETIAKHKPDRVQAVATAAAREASNAKKFLQICERYKIPIITLSGEEEANMSFQGAIDPSDQDKTLLIDIGGGSTEYILGQAGKIHFSTSIPYGAVKLTEKWISTQPVIKADEAGLRNFIREKTKQVWQKAQEFKIQKIWAVAGTPTALAAATIGGFDSKKIDGFVLNRELLRNWIEKLRSSSIETKKEKFGFGARADVIFAGSVILDELLLSLEHHEIHVSTKGIRYGLAYAMVDHSN